MSRDAVGASLAQGLLVLVLMIQVALVDLAYVHLGLNDPVTTLAFTGRLLANKTSVVNQ